MRATRTKRRRRGVAKQMLESFETVLLVRDVGIAQCANKDYRAVQSSNCVCVSELVARKARLPVIEPSSVGSALGTVGPHRGIQDDAYGRVADSHACGRDRPETATPKPGIQTFPTEATDTVGRASTKPGQYSAPARQVVNTPGAGASSDKSLPFLGAGGARDGSASRPPCVLGRGTHVLVFGGRIRCIWTRHKERQ